MAKYKVQVPRANGMVTYIIESDADLKPGDKTLVVFRNGDPNAPRIASEKTDMSPYFNKEEDDIRDVHDYSVSYPAFTVSTSVIDTATVFRCWIVVTLVKVENASGYLIAYKKNSDTVYSIINVAQFPDSMMTVSLPDLDGNTSYDVKCCSLTIKGLQSSWSPVTTVTTPTNVTPPSTPANLSCTPTIGGLLVKWNMVYANDLLEFKVYHNTVNDSNTATAIGTVLGDSYLWRVTNSATDYTTHYFWVTAVDTALNESAKQANSVNGIPLRSLSQDLSIELRNMTSNIKFTYSDGNYDYIAWTSGNITWSDGTSCVVNAGSVDGLSGSQTNPVIWYFYWNENSKSGSNYVLQYSNNFSDAVGTGKALLALASIDGVNNPTIIPFNSYVPTIGAGVLAAHSVLANHLATSTIEAIGNQITIQANQLFVDATTTFSAMLAEGTGAQAGTTVIKGGRIQTGSILITGLDTSTQTKINNGDAAKSRVDEWGVYNPSTGVTEINGGKINANSITLTKLGTDVTSAISTANGNLTAVSQTASAALTLATGVNTTVESWKYSNSTLIDGGKIYTGTIAADRIYAHSITTDQIDIIGGRAFKVRPSEEVQFVNNGMMGFSVYGTNTGWAFVQSLTLTDGKIDEGCRIKFDVECPRDPYGGNGYFMVKITLVHNSVETEILQPTIFTFGGSIDTGVIYEGDVIKLYADFYRGTGAMNPTKGGIGNLRVCYSTYAGRDMVAGGFSS